MVTVDLKQLIEELANAEQRRDEIRGDVMRRVFADFDCRLVGSSCEKNL